MRKVYLLRDEEQDGTVLDALIAMGLPPSEESVENPACPVCGAPLLVACQNGREFDVLIWESLGEDCEPDAAGAWFLVCSDLTCEHEEQVQRSADPAGAVLYDLRAAHEALDESIGLFCMFPPVVREVVGELEQLYHSHPSRKLLSILDEARDQLKFASADLQKRVAALPCGARISVDVGDEQCCGTLLTATDTHLLVTGQEGELVAINLEGVHTVSTHREPTNLTGGDWVAVEGATEWVVIRGQHVRLDWVDRLGAYKVSTGDQAVAEALGLQARGQGCWSGNFRRSDVEAKYVARKLARVAGQWVQVTGYRTRDRCPNVRTDDPGVAARLGLKPQREPQASQPEAEWPVSHYNGVVPSDWVEEQTVERVYAWPIPEA